MQDSAHIHSTEAIERFRLALAEFEKRVQGALDGLSAELNRATQWLEHDCPHFWKQQEKAAADAVHQAKLDLERCLMFPVAGERPTCREEKAALKLAKDRWNYCLEKKEKVRHWRGVLSHEVFEYTGRIGHLRRTLETDLPAARAKLQLIVRRIEGYRIERPPEARETYQESVIRDEKKE
jgi:hypothetical protein